MKNNRRLVVTKF